MTNPEYRDSRIAGMASPVVVGMLMWVDPAGRRWIAPLGSADPVPGQAPGPAWLPIRVERRADA
jgi:hypothetical protein